MSVSVCLSLCLSVCVFVRDHIFGTTRTIFTSFFVHVIYGRGSVFLFTSGFVDDVVFARKLRLLDVAARLKRSAHAALGSAINRSQ